MFGFLGYNFLKDINCLDPTPVNITSLNNTKIQNGVFDRVYITGDTTFTDPYKSFKEGFYKILSCFDK